MTYQVYFQQNDVREQTHLTFNMYAFENSIKVIQYKIIF